MTWNNLIRQAHRWLSILFTLTVVANLVALFTKQQAVWIGLMALFPLILLMISGLWMFFRPYFGRRSEPMVEARARGEGRRGLGPAKLEIAARQG